ncbi:hypothetical protein CYMTET_36772 [Cymbomonas tetramitiformis]|uniref:Uncharacterized protein n=1 Tax=Cymbomonas tetramitiformis TaxID=36881 RepID=A0AAE0CH20_9CHLO|nr:hypothetical protein CYMTET_36772 [Cymbomonas tetramitiformis]
MAPPLQPVLREILRTHPEVYFIAYLDDIHILGEPEQVRAAYDILGEPEQVRAAYAILGEPEQVRAAYDILGEPEQPHMLMRGALEHDLAIQRCLQEVAGSPYPLGEEAVALGQLPTRELLPHLGAPEGTDAGGHPLVAGFVSAMEDVRGASERVLAARADGHVLPEALKRTLLSRRGYSAFPGMGPRDYIRGV